MDLLLLEKFKKNMRKIDQLFAEYAESHQNQTNKFIHWICVPLIFFTIVGFISLIPAPHFCAPYFGCISIASIVALVLVSIFYFNLSWRISIIMLLIMLLLDILPMLSMYILKKILGLFISPFLLSHGFFSSSVIKLKVKNRVS